MEKLDGKTDAFSILDVLRIMYLFLSYNLARSHFMYVQEETLYKKMHRVNEKFSALRVCGDAILHQSLHPSSVKQMAIPVVFHAILLPSIRNHLTK